MNFTLRFGIYSFIGWFVGILIAVGIAESFKPPIVICVLTGMAFGCLGMCAGAFLASNKD